MCPVCHVHVVLFKSNVPTVHESTLPVPPINYFSNRGSPICIGCINLYHLTGSNSTKENKHYQTITRVLATAAAPLALAVLCVSVCSFLIVVLLLVLYLVLAAVPVVAAVVCCCCRRSICTGVGISPANFQPGLKKRRCSIRLTSPARTCSKPTTGSFASKYIEVSSKFVVRRNHRRQFSESPIVLQGLAM